MEQDLKNSGYLTRLTKNSRILQFSTQFQISILAGNNSGEAKNKPHLKVFVL